MHKSKGLCLHADPDRGSCSLTRRRCPGWRKCLQYKGVREKGMVKASMIIIKSPSGKPGESEQLPLLAPLRSTLYRDLAGKSKGVISGRK